MRSCFAVAALAFAVSATPNASHAQSSEAAAVVDPTAEVAHPVLEPALHKSLPEQYIWLASPSGTEGRDDQAIPRFFRYHFRLDSAPKEATLYVAGPDQIRAYLNGELVAHGDHSDDTNTNPQVLIANVHENLKAGDNCIAVEATGGSPLAVKIVLAAETVDAPPVAMTGPGWKVTLASAAGWQKADFDDSLWSTAATLGSIEQMLGDFRRWYLGASNLEANSDSEMYRWPGYDGISPYLARMPLSAQKVIDVAAGKTEFKNLSALTSLASHDEFEVVTPASGSKDSAASLVLDFGRESDGRIEFASDSKEQMRVRIQYGESREEAINKPYLGVNEILIPPGATVYGPKSAFRYARVEFVPSKTPMRFKAIRLDYIFYPVQYRGSFESSDALLNRIWKIGAYTSHLCMQDAIWDAPKRDRLPWMGDLDVSGDVIDTAFADHFLMQTTLDRLNHEAGNPMHQEVNGIPGYSAFWVMGEADYYRHIGDATYLHSIHDDIIRLLDYIAGDLDADHLFANPRKAWPFVDWSPEMQHDTPDTRRATTFEFYRAFSEGAWMLREAGDAAAADKYQAIADSIRQSAQQKMLEAQSGTFGSRWQPNAMAIFSGVATPQQTATIWKQVLSKRDGFMISPYYDFYVISAAASAGHRRETLDWIRQYWGGMVNEGATSFWEAYDPAWPKEDYHANLQADDSKGYFVSLSHGWSSGPTAWLTEQILGIRPTAAGYTKTTIRPDLAGLAWARGAVQAPNGQIKVDYRAPASKTAKFAVRIELPGGVDASVSMPVCGADKSVNVNGAAMNGDLAEDGTRMVVHLPNAGKYTLESNCAGK
jgi:alpha-L-rhamnosidase